MRSMMPMRLIYLTGAAETGRMAEEAGVDWIMVDLEYRGKANRQAGRDTVISAHSLDDARAMRGALSVASLLVRVNPLGHWSREEIDGAIAAGADVVMLPFFTAPDEVRRFVDMVGGRARTCLLVETMGAVERIEAILAVPGIDFIHIGLNDIHIERGTRFMFEPYADGLLDGLAGKIRGSGIPFGIGGMARIGEKIPPAEAIMAEHRRLGSSGVILSRTFAAMPDGAATGDIRARLVSGVRAVRACQARLDRADAAFFEENLRQVRDQIAQVVRSAGHAGS